MNAELENTLAGLGADARRMVSAMKGAFPEECRAGGEPRSRRQVLPWLAAASGLAAASVAAVFAFRAAIPPPAENGGVHPRAPRESHNRCSASRSLRRSSDTRNGRPSSGLSDAYRPEAGRYLRKNAHAPRLQRPGPHQLRPYPRERVPALPRSGPRRRYRRWRPPPESRP